jgi:hypothetical protein
MTKQADREQVIVTIAHPFGDIDVLLDTWKEKGPGPRRFVRPVAAKTIDGRPLSLRVIPLKYRNNWLSRTLIRLGVLKNPWKIHRNPAPR